VLPIIIASGRQTKGSWQHFVLLLSHSCWQLAAECTEWLLLLYRFPPSFVFLSSFFVRLFVCQMCGGSRSAAAAYEMSVCVCVCVPAALGSDRRQLVIRKCFWLELNKWLALFAKHGELFHTPS
jgi:hypothetical protein